MLFHIQIESLKGNLWGDNCYKFEFGHYQAKLENYSSVPQIYGALDELDAIEKLEKGLF